MNDRRIEQLQDMTEAVNNQLDGLGEDEEPKIEGKGAVPNALCLKETNKKDMYAYKTNFNAFQKKHKEDFPKHKVIPRLEQLEILRDQTNNDYVDPVTGEVKKKLGLIAKDNIKKQSTVN